MFRLLTEGTHALERAKAPDAKQDARQLLLAAFHLDMVHFLMNRMQELEENLGEKFLRVHRAYLVNVEQIAELDLKGREIRMKNGEKCMFSRNMKGVLLKRI